MSIAEKKGYKKWTGNEFDYYQPEPIDKKKVKGTWAYNLDQIKQGLSNFGDKLYEGATDIDPLLQLGLLHSVYGDNSILQMYNQNIEAEKNREAQRAYNEYLKEYDRAQAAREQSAAYKKELKDAEVEMATLNRDLVKATAPEAAVIKKRQESLMAKYPELLNSNEEALAKQKEEEEYQAKKIGVRSAIPNVFADEKAINAQIANVMASDLRPQDKEELVKELQSKKSTAQLAKEASQSAVASHSGKKTTESLDEKELAKKYQEMKNRNYPLNAEQEQIRRKFYK